MNARVELAAADCLDVVRESLARAVGEYHADLSAEDEERRRAVVEAFVARVRNDVADEQKTQAHAEALKASLQMLEADRQAAWQRYTATLENLAVLQETSEDLRSLAIQSLSLEDETKRYFTGLLEARQVDARKETPPDRDGAGAVHPRGMKRRRIP